MKAFTMKVTLMLLLLRRFLQECLQGCLKCSSNNECQYCDFTKNFYLQDGSCQNGQIENCEVYSVQGQCLLCQPNFYLDEVTNQCLAVFESIRIEHCVYYETENSCMTCEPTFYLNGLNCSSVTTTIDNCKTYTDLDKCGECVEGFIIQHDQKGCLEEKDVANCQTYTSVKCNKCENNYHLQDSFWRNWINHLLKTDLVQKEERALTASVTTKVETSSNCIAIIPQHCEQLKDFQTCHICLMGYFLKNSDCVVNPPLAIAHCEDYTSQDRCRKCEQGFRLTPAPDYKCRAVQTVQFCAEFDGSAFDTRCLQCKERYYLKFDNLCEERTLTVEFCLTHEVDKDQCAQCETGFQLTSDGKKCLPETPSCASYLESDIETEKLICEECKDYHYLNIEDLCTLGTTENCRVYERIIDQCRLCEDNYFLNADLQCEQHPLIDGCIKYDPYVENRCVECQFDRFLLTLQTECHQVQVDNCRVHKTIDHCAECDQGYSLLNNGQCTELDPDLHCLVGEYGLCIKCENGYTLEEGLCIIQLIYEKDVCQLSEMPIDYKSALQCTSREELLRIGVDADFYDNGNCLSFEYDEDFNYKCVKCTANYTPDQTGKCVLTSTNPTCQDDTTFFYRNLNFKIKKEQENLVYVQDDVCLRIAKNDPAEINHCKTYGIQKGQFNLNKEVQYGCIECNDESAPNRQFQVVKPETNRETLYKDSTNIFWKTQFECTFKNLTSTNITDVVWGNATAVDNCEYFQLLQHDKLGCMRCKNQYNGIVKNQAIHRCLEYDPVDLQCTKCQENFLLEDNQKSCTYYTDLTTPRSYTTNCELESFDEQKCYLCQDGYTLTDDGSSCIQFSSNYPIANCTAHTHNSLSAIAATCEHCDDGYYLTEDKQNCWRVDNCHIPASNTTCEVCNLTYALNATTNTCYAVSDCDFNDPNSSNCLVGSEYNITTLNNCTAVTVDNCTAYDQVQGECTECASGRYLFVDTNTTSSLKVSECVLEGSYPSVALNSSTHTSEDCKVFGIVNASAPFDDNTRYGCIQCADGYYFNDKDEQGLADYNCIEDSHYDINQNNTDESFLNLTLYVNDTNCAMYDFLRDECVKCKNDTYYSTSRCCIDTQYYNGTACVNISNTDYENCTQIAMVKNQGYYECLGCIANNTLVDGTCQFATPCNNFTHGQCIDLAGRNCSVFDTEQFECETCTSGNYTVPSNRDFCCSEGQFVNSTGLCQNLTDLSITSDSNKETNMEASCLQYNELSGECLKCAENKTFTGRICADTSDLYEHCAKIDTESNLCEICEDGYHLNEFKTCCQISSNFFFNVTTGSCSTINSTFAIDDCLLYTTDAADQCDTCKDGFYNYQNKACCKHGELLVGTIVNSDNCTYPSDDSYRYCSLMELDSTDKGQYSCKMCNLNYASQINATNTFMCCSHGQFYNSTTSACEDNSSCKVIDSSNTTACEACSLDKQLSSDNQCESLLSNCDVLDGSDSSVCTQCNYGYISDGDLASTACVSLEGVDVEGLYNCGLYNSTESVSVKNCTGCINSLQIETDASESCCPIGTYELSDQLCVPNPVENCAVYNSTSEQCTKCFQDDDHCTVEYDFTSMNTDLKNRYFQLVGYTDLRSSTNARYYLGNDSKKNCCKYGYYFDGESCVEIEFPHCSEFNYQNYKCKKCFDDFILVDNTCKKISPAQCSSKSDTINYYNSNGHCCPEGKYWSEDEQLCEDIPDSNCNKSDDGIHCSECATGLVAQTFSKVKYELHYRATLNNCPHIHKHKSFYNCIAEADLTTQKGYTQLSEFQVIAENCKEVDYTNKKCKECLDGYYRTPNVPICCQDGYTGVEVEGLYFCRQTTTIKDSCKVFDAVSNKCLQCNDCNSVYTSGLTDKCQLSGGMCCPRFQHFNLMTGQCENMLLGECQDVDLVTKMCRKCPEGYYFYYSGCVKEGYFFNSTDFNGLTSGTDSTNDSVCLQKSPQGHCAVCDTNPGGGSDYFYNYKGDCVQQKEKFVNGTAISGTGFVDGSAVVCLELDSYDNCAKCDNGYYLTNGRCCANGSYWNGSACTATSISDCAKADEDKQIDYCVECSSKILVQIDKPSTTANYTSECVSDFQDSLDDALLWGDAAIDSVSEFVALAQIQSTLNCVDFKDGECQTCASGFILALKEVDVSSAQDNSDKRMFTRCMSGTKITNCSYYDAEDPSKCLYCNGSKKLDSSTKQCTGDALKNCLKSDSSGCLECRKNYLIYNMTTYPSGVETVEPKCMFNTYTPCAKFVDKSLQCEHCEPNYALNFQKTFCDPDLSNLQAATGLANCTSGVSKFLNNTDFDCYACNQGYYLNGTSPNRTCESVDTTVDFCKVHDTNVTCGECVTGYYATNERTKCCPQSTLYYESDCVDWRSLTKDNCKAVQIQTSSTHHLEKIQCSSCASGYQLTNGMCCPENSVGMERFCYTPKSSRSSDCKILDNMGRCGECKSTHYLTQGGCCTEGNYFDTVAEVCKDITNEGYQVNGATTACLRLNDDMQCTKCSNNGRLYNGVCYDNTDAINIANMTQATISTSNDYFPKCSEVIDFKCTQCESSYTLGGTSSSSKCCGKSGENYYYDEEEQKCILIDSDCRDFNHNTNKCQQCASNKYSNGLQCCETLKYYDDNTNACVLISTLTETFAKNCQALTREDLQNKKCSVCTSNFSLVNGICYNDAAIINICQNKQDENCITCSNNKIVSGLNVSVCCDDGKIFDETAKECQTATGLTNCKNQLSTTECSECESDYYLLNHTTCCQAGYAKNTTSGGCSSTETIEHCVEWNTLNSTSICETCKDGYQSFDYILDGNFTSKCCPDGQILDPLSEKCIERNLMTISDNCEEFDIYGQASYHKLPECSDLQATQYISNGIPCNSTDMFLAATNTTSCISINTTTYPNCTEVSDGECLDCSNGYLIKGHCCREGEFYNGTACQISTENGLQNCTQFYEECPEEQFGTKCSNFTVGDLCKQCNTTADYYLTYNYKCCLKGYYWNETAGDCFDYNASNAGDDYKDNINDNCEEFGRNFECLSCNNTLSITADGFNCCNTTDTFIYINGTCSDDYEILTSCRIYNYTTFVCEECASGYYLTLGKCCAEGEYYERSSNLCKAIDTSKFKIDTQCNRYDEERRCIGCSNGYEINFDEQCVQVPTGCKVFDANTFVCDECISGYSLSEFGNCCATNQFDSYGVCMNITTQLQIDNCKEYYRGKCSKCQDNHYLIQGECCPYGTYYDRTNSTNPYCTAYSSTDYNNVPHCQQYGYAKEFCDVCEDDYMLVRYLWGDKCVDMKPSSSSHIANCLKYKNTFNSTGLNEHVECTQCSFAVGSIYKLQTEDTPTTAKDILTELQAPLINNCTVYHITSQFQASNFTCIKCHDDYYVDVKENKCVQRIENNRLQCVGHKPLDKDECTQCDDYYFVNYLRQCEAITMDNCLHYDRAQEVCLECDAVDDVAATAGYNQTTDDEDTAYRQMRLKYFLTNDYVRSKCSLEKHTPETFPDHYKGYIEECKDDSANQQDKLAINVDNFYDKWYQVHFCNDTSKIPVAFVKAGENFTDMPYAIGNYNDNDLTSNSTWDLDDIDEYVAANSGAFNKTVDFGEATHCISNYGDALGGRNGDPKDTPVEHCAMVMINVEMPFEVNQGTLDNPDFSQLSTFCTACKTGYVPKRNGFMPIIVNRCDAVANCDVTDATAPKVLNGCAKCNKDTATLANNFSFMVNEEGTIDYSQCVQTNDIHCELLNRDNTCKYCEAGYLPNYDGKCAQYRQLNCEDSNFSFQKGFTVDNFEYVLAYLGTHKGCNQCSDGYKGLLIETRKLVCSQSVTLETQDFENTSTVYDTRCEQYGVVDDKAVCTLCVPGYLLNQNRKCIQTQLEYCSIVVDATQCHQCKDEYILENGKCVQQIIENCRKHSINNAGDPICTECEDTYLLSDENICIQGPIDNCRTYNDLPICIQCIDNYVLVTLKDGSQQCSAINQEIHPNCVQYRSSSFNDNQVECLQCATLEFLPVYYEIDQDICLQLEIVDNCIKYDKEPLFVHSSLKCLECQEKYVLQGDKCEERKVFVDHCIQYSKFEHKCIECSKEYYLSADGIQCILEPSGIPNCEIYTDYEQCKYCIDDNYLYKNECAKVPTPIKNCKYYKDSHTCALCQDGTILENNQCKEYQVSCLTYLSSSECATCPEGQGIKYENGKRICAVFNVVQYCDVHNQVEPYACEKCLSGYFLYDELPRNKCVASITPVGNCVEYSGPEDCSLCADGYLLSFDQKSCIQKSFSDNCISRSEVQPYCVQCQAGFVLDTNHECVQDNSNIPNGCLGLDRYGKCHMCRTGYYQNANKECIEIGN